MKNVVVFIATLLLTGKALAFDCYFTVAKDNCWSNYQITASVSDAQSHQTLTSLTVPQGQSYGRQLFNCQPGQTLMFTASFSPAIWEGENNKQYNGEQFWVLPAKINAKQSAWEVPVCFSKDFADVPYPQGATSNCACDFKSIPAIPPKVIP